MRRIDLLQKFVFESDTNRTLFFSKEKSEQKQFLTMLDERRCFSELVREYHQETSPNIRIVSFLLEDLPTKYNEIYLIGILFELFCTVDRQIVNKALSGEFNASMPQTLSVLDNIISAGSHYYFSNKVYQVLFELKSHLSIDLNSELLIESWLNKIFSYLDTDSESQIISFFQSTFSNVLGLIQIKDLQALHEVENIYL